MAVNRCFTRASAEGRRIRGAAALITLLMAFLFSLPGAAEAQTILKKGRLALPAKTVSFLAFYVAHRKGFYREEGIEFEPIIMQPSLASTAVLTGDLDYNGAVTAVIGAAVSGRPMKAVLFTVARPLQYLMSRSDIKDARGEYLGSENNFPLLVAMRLKPIIGY